MKRTLIVEMNAKVPFDEEMNATYSELSPEDQAEQLDNMRVRGETWFRSMLDDGADVTVNVYVSEEGE
ncbi:hypothetical protein GCM10008915_36400 [Bifidobacterium pullorum subsp. gallinarum]